MKSIKIIKETEDLRENRNKILKVGTKFTCVDELAKQYISKKLAEEVGPEIMKAEQEKVEKELDKNLEENENEN